MQVELKTQSPVVPILWLEKISDALFTIQGNEKLNILCYALKYAWKLR